MKLFAYNNCWNKSKEHKKYCRLVWSAMSCNVFLWHKFSINFLCFFHKEKNREQKCNWNTFLCVVWRKKLNILWHTIFVCNVLIIFFQSETNETEACKDIKSLPFIQVKKKQREKFLVLSVENVYSQRPFSSELLIIKWNFCIWSYECCCRAFWNIHNVKKRTVCL